MSAIASMSNHSVSDVVMERRLAWVADHLFAKMEDRFGSLWSQRYGNVPYDRMVRTWAEDLSDLTADQIRRGMDACRSVKFPPTLPEFRELCLATGLVDARLSYDEAIEQMRRRYDEDGSDSWSHPAVYWAATKIGYFDLRNSTWSVIEKRWTAALNIELQKGAWEPVPVAVPALPAPGQQHITNDQARERLVEICSRLGVSSPIKRMPV